MGKNLSLLKPNLKMVRYGETLEKVTYLEVNEEIDLKNDVALGAVQFSELESLTDKDNEPKYIIISCDNKEQGYMAVSYLNAVFNKKHDISNADYDNYDDYDLSCDIYEDDEEFQDLYFIDDDGNIIDENDDFDMKELVSNPWKVPIIDANEFSTCFDGGSTQNFGIGIFPAQLQNGVTRKRPYWMDCVNNSVCVVYDCHRNMWMSDDVIMNGLNSFENNDKVYVLCIKDEDSMTNASFGSESAIEERNSTINEIVLNYTADEVEVSIGRVKNKYYKRLFCGVMNDKKLTAKKGFNYERYVNMAIAMAKEEKCELIENLVKYAIKDKKRDEGEWIEISNDDFKFMRRFCVVDDAKASKKDVFDDTKELVGMDSVKQNIQELVYAAMLKKRWHIPEKGKGRSITYM